MPLIVSSLRSRLRNPEHTGENRCVPCTVANLAIGAVASIVVGFEWPLVGTALFLVAAAVVVVRGYLVPGTPTVTNRYLPERVLRWFDKERTVDRSATESPDLNPEQFLRDRAVVHPCADGDDLCLDNGFADAWRSVAAELDPKLPAETVAPLVDDAPGRVATVQGRNGFYVEGEDYRYQWVSRGALLVDVAADRVLTDRLADWEGRPLAHRLTVLQGLRAFLTTCPLCGGDVRFGTDTVQSCCRSTEVVAVTCEDCDERFMELDVDST